MSRRRFTTHCLNVDIFVFDKEECFLQLKTNYLKAIVKIINGPLCGQCFNGASDAMFMVSDRYAMKSALKNKLCPDYHEMGITLSASFGNWYPAGLLCLS